MLSRSFILASALVAISSSAHASVLLTDFSSLPDGDPLTGYSGWSSSEADPEIGYPLSYGVTIGGQPGAAVGGFFATPAGSSYSVSHTIGLPTATISLDFSVTGSSVDFPDQNNYSLSLFNGATSVFTLSLVADTTPAASTDDLWNIFIGASNTGISVSEDGLYNMSLTFAQNGANLNYALVINNGISSTTFNGTTSTAATNNFSKLEIGTNIGDGADWGDNSFAFTNIQVPEPSSAALLSLAGLGLFARRRRA